MDESESVNRRDAVTGLGLLGALTVLLVGTIFYRIINPSPPAKISLEGLTIAAEGDRSAAPFASQPPEATSIRPMHQDAEVSGAAFRGEPSTAAAAPSTDPSFVAPSSR